MNLLITICARGGSKGIPGKNIKPLNGKPLIAYSIEIASKFKDYYKNTISVDIDLSTDSEEIKKVAAECGLYTDYTRADLLSNDSAGKVDAIVDILKYNQIKKGILYDYVLDLDVTSPLRTLEDLIRSFELICIDDNAINLFSVNIANRNPYFNMVEQNEEGYFEVVKKPKDLVLSRQKSPKVYDLNASFYFYKKIFFDLNFKSVYSGKSMIYEMPHICFDLDHLIDFEFMEYLFANKKFDFDI